MEQFKENGISLVYDVIDGQFKLFHLSTLEYDEKLKIDKEKWAKSVEVHIAGQDPFDHHGAKHTGSSEGITLQFEKINDYKNEWGRKFEVISKNENVQVTSHFQFYNGIMAISSYTQVKNISNKPLTLEYVSSFELVGIDRGTTSFDELTVYMPHNYWLGEFQWKKYTPSELGLTNVSEFSMKRITQTNTGSWSSKEFLPMGMIENTKTKEFLFWQIESNGSWHSEISSIANSLYLQLSGATFQENMWTKVLKPNEEFTSVSASLMFAQNSIEQVVKQATLYRRRIRRENEDNKNLPIIFNDYMNCLNADPTTEKELPLIDLASSLGVEYFCIDAGWYDDGYWWDTIGEWKEAKTRFNGKLNEVFDYIRAKGMKGGLWLEIESMGVNCPLATSLDDSWFFCRNGKRIKDHGRYQLDFRNEQVLAFANEVVDRVIKDYGVEYLKFDYNIEIGAGTEINSDSLGDGLLEYNRAYIKFLEGLFARHENLVIENCASGGMRLDAKQLALLSIQSSSDQTCYYKYPYIVANALSAVTPEQCAVWAYPLENATDEEVIFNMISAMLMRIHLSGRIDKINSENLAYIQEGLNLYKDELRENIKDSFPIFLNGFASWNDSNASLAIENGKRTFLAVWHIEGDNNVKINFEKLKGKKVVQIYPKNKQIASEIKNDCLNLSFECEKSARLFEVID